jgi:O-antigen ligase
VSRNREVSISSALWLPIIWFVIGGSRNISEWLDSTVRFNPDRYTEGSALDRSVLTTLLVLGAIVLARRGVRLEAVARENRATILYFAYCAVSVFWSDYPDVAFKRWIRSSGDLIMVLVVLTEEHRVAAIRQFLARSASVLLPVSILLIRYYPEYGRGYSRWTGGAYWIGATTDKNSLGMICMICALASVSYLLHLCLDRKETRTDELMLAQITLGGLAMWLIVMADSATASACLFVGMAVIMLARSGAVTRRVSIVHAGVVAAVGGVLWVLFFSTGTTLLEDVVGRDSTITGRTDMWPHVFSMVTNPWVGSGYESFWVGERLEAMSRLYHSRPNQAHNGYIEIYLNLGWIGIALFAGVLISGYRTIVDAVRERAELASLRLAYFVVAVIYNLTEGGFKMMHPVWIVLLLSMTVAPASWAIAIRRETKVLAYE